MKPVLLVIVLGLSAASLAGCGRRGSSPAAGAPSDIASAHGNTGTPVPSSRDTAGLSSALQARSGGPNEAAGVRWTVPARWSAEGPRPMRIATYVVAPAAGDAEGAECAVYYFGPNQGGSVDANIQRWTAQFQPATSSRRSTRAVNGLEVSLLDVKGTYTAPAGPMMQSQGTKPGWRMRCAIVPAPAGPVFFKLTGPEKTMALAGAGFDQLVGSLRKP